jgi:hypothetical protein
VPGVQLITQDEIAALLGLERQKSLLGCGDDKCMAEVGGALGVDRLVTGRLSKVGETWLFNLKALDPAKAKVVAQVDRNARKASIDDMIEQIPAMVGELFGAAPAKGPMRTVEAPKADRPGRRSPPRPSLRPPRPPPERRPPSSRPTASTSPSTRPSSSTTSRSPPTARATTWPSRPGTTPRDRVFYGDGKTFHQVRKVGGGSDGRTGQFSFTLWDPRFRDSYGPDADFESREGKLTLTCGQKKKVEVEYKLAKDAEAKKLLKSARFYKPRWRRQAYALARDDEGNYFFVDEARRERWGSEGERDFHFYMGTKGNMVPYEVKDYSFDSADEIFVTAAGRLKRPTTGEGKTAEWIVGKQKTPVRWLALDGQAQLIYTSLGVYAGEQLGSPCDGVAK